MDPLTADGAYDRMGAYADVNRCHPDAKVVVHPRADAVLSATVGTVPTQRDRR